MTEQQLHFPVIPRPSRSDEALRTVVRVDPFLMNDLRAAHARLRELDDLPLGARLNLPLGERNRRADATLAALDALMDSLSG